MNLLQQINSHLVEVEDLTKDQYSLILGYPRCSSEELESRVNELYANGVTALLFEGKSKIGKFDLLGKGCVSVVVKAICGNKVVGLKIRRTDADRDTMEREAMFLKIANSVDVGPTLINQSRNFLLMSLAKGETVFKYIEAENDRNEVSHVMSEILWQCYKLDETGLDHGELSDMRQHVIIGDGVTMIDFESASISRRVSNVTTATQYLFIGGFVAQKVRRLLRINSMEPIILSLRQYKNEVSKENLELLKNVLHL